MSNVIQIKHGAGAPADGTLAPYELGYDTAHNELFIGVPGVNNVTTSLKISTSKENDEQEGREGLYCWQKFASEITYSYELITEEKGTSKPSDMATMPTYYSSYNITEDGYFELTGSSTTSPSTTGTYYIAPTGQDVSKATYIYERYVAWSGGSGTIYYAKLSLEANENETKIFKGYIVSNDSEAYPSDGQVDNYWYIQLNNP